METSFAALLGKQQLIAIGLASTNLHFNTIYI